MDYIKLALRDEIKIFGRKGIVIRLTWPYGSSAAHAIVKLDEPIHFSDIPGSAFYPGSGKLILTNRITEEMALPETDLLQEGTAKAWEMLMGSLPKGRWDKKFYRLNKPMPLSDIIELCYENWVGEDQCWLQAAYLKVIPVIFQKPGY